MKTAALAALAAAIIALALIPGRHRRLAHPAASEPRAHARALSLDDMERLRKARRALIEAERVGPASSAGHSE